MRSFTHQAKKRRVRRFDMNLFFRVLFISARISRYEMPKCIDSIFEVFSSFWHRVHQAKNVGTVFVTFSSTKKWARVESSCQYICTE